MSSSGRNLVLLTGATGFIGGAYLARLKERGVVPRVLGRQAIEGCDHVVMDLEAEAGVDASLAMAGIDVMVHCAGFSHAFSGSDTQLAQRHYQLNCRAALDLAESAAAAGVRRFVFCSSVKAMGAPGNVCVNEDFTAPPETVYGWAKAEAERGLRAIASRSGMEIVILRFAMVFGPGSRGNLERMQQAVARGTFPPLPETGNRRSLLYIEDALDALDLATTHSDAPGKTFIVAHPETYSGHELFSVMRAQAGKTALSWAVPAVLLRLMGCVGDLFGRLLQRRMPVDSQVIARLLDSECYCSNHLRESLGWTPQYNLRDGLRAAALQAAAKPNP